MTPLSEWRDPSPEQLGESPSELLERLPGPTAIQLSGREPGPARVVSTLLHGNEPSGLIAFHRYLTRGAPPRRDLVLIVGNVEAARQAPQLTRRAREGGRDLNRCFEPPHEGVDGVLAGAIRERIRLAAPELVVDLHNTSGRGPSYAVCSRVEPAHHALASLFVERIVHTELRLGTLMEACEGLAPTVTVECGGASDPRSHDVAFAGLSRVAELERLDEALRLSVLSHPLRLEVVEGARVGIGEAPVDGCDVTLASDLDLHNFGLVERGAAVGFLGPRGLSALRLRGPRELPVERLFAEHEGRLVAARPFEPLMITVNPRIAESDCLMYVVEL